MNKEEHSIKQQLSLTIVVYIPVLIFGVIYGENFNGSWSVDYSSKPDDPNSKVLFGQLTFS